MSEFNSVSVGNQWVDISVLANITLGISYQIQNTGTSKVLLWFGDTEPVQGSTSGFTLDVGGSFQSLRRIRGFENNTKVWARCVSTLLPSKLVFTNTALKRNFTDLTAAGGQYYELSDPIALSGDFEIEIKIVTTDTLSGITLLGRENGEDYLFIRPDRSVRLRIDRVDYQTNPNDVSLGILNSIKAVRVDDNLLIYLNEVQIGSFTSVTGVFTFDRVGQFANTFFFNGIISDLKIWTDGDRNTGTLIGDFPLDEDWTQGNVAVNRAAVLGSELGVSSSTVTIPNDYSSTTIPGTQAITNGAKYLYSFKLVSAPSGAAARLRSLSGAGGSYITAGQSVDIKIGVADESTITLQGSIAGEYEVELVSVKQIPSTTPYATAENITSDDAELFTQDGNGDWLGEELWDGSSSVSNGTEGTFAYFGNTESAVVSNNYKWTVTVAGITEGQVYLWGLSAPINTDGLYSEESTSSVSLVGARTGNSQPNSGTTLQNISIKRLLQTA